MDLTLLKYAKQELSKDELNDFMLTFQGQQRTNTVGIILALLLGCFGAHWFYLGNNTRAVVYLVLGTIGWFLIIPGIVICILCIIEAINMNQTVTVFNQRLGRSIVAQIIAMRD